jgi:transcriptional regulator with XRE-family HTH domain
MKLSEFVKKEREKRGLSLYQLAKLVSSYDASVYHVEAGRSDNVISRLNGILEPLGYKFKLVPVDGNDVEELASKPVREGEDVREGSSQVKEGLKEELPSRWKVAKPVAKLVDKATKLEMAKQALAVATSKKRQ